MELAAAYQPKPKQHREREQKKKKKKVLEGLSVGRWRPSTGGIGVRFHTLVHPSETRRALASPFLAACFAKSLPIIGCGHGYAAEHGRHRNSAFCKHPTIYLQSATVALLCMLCMLCYPCLSKLPRGKLPRGMLDVACQPAAPPPRAGLLVNACWYRHCHSWSGFLPKWLLACVLLAGFVCLLLRTPVRASWSYVDTPKGCEQHPRHPLSLSLLPGAS